MIEFLFVFIGFLLGLLIATMFTSGNLKDKDLMIDNLCEKLYYSGLKSKIYASYINGRDGNEMLEILDKTYENEKIKSQKKQPTTQHPKSHEFDDYGKYRYRKGENNN